MSWQLQLNSSQLHGLLPGGRSFEYLEGGSGKALHMAAQLHNRKNRHPMRKEWSILLEIDVDFTFDAEENAIVFDESQIPPAQFYITANYRPLGTSSTQDTGGGEE